MKVVFALCLVAVAVACVLAEVDVNDPTVQEGAREAAKILSKRFPEKHHHILLKVKKARKLDATGYQIDIILGLTKCLKSEVEFDQADECELKDSISTYKKCTIVFTKGDTSVTVNSTGCILTSKKDV